MIESSLPTHALLSVIDTPTVATVLRSWVRSLRLP
ncbi:hypothetical protein QGX15_gp073 [Pseudomonas phage psageK4e]|uniref:Uncharacterized protein n=1 Tax=Pseudomonas phage psageK4e TaxID=2875723 RepID=A0AAE8XMK9_9CAUD|nr:hypothetical protein QGX15_gp073 [Pseudomonas phage psageK4e]UAW53622.1 hypothetical protein psageK4e_174 [Pseudomonas phage psageK4e]